MSDRRPLRRWLMTHAVAGVMLFATTWLLTTDERDPVRDPALREALLAADPDVVLLGNSILHDGVNIDLLQELLDGELGGGAPVVFKHAVGGTYTSYWYLVLKNYVLRYSSPRVVIVPFRDPLMTLPALRTTGPYAANLQRVSSGPDALFDELVTGRRDSDIGSIVLRELAAWSTLYDRRDEIRTGLFESLKDLPARRSAGALPAYAAAVDDVLPVRVADPRGDAGAGAMEMALATELMRSEATFRFSEVVGESLLPAMVDMCNEHGTRLVLLRLKKSFEPDWTSGVAPGLLESYTEQIDAWLAAHDVTVLDTTVDERLGPWFFRGIDHLGQDGRRYLTVKLAHWLVRCRRDPTTGGAAFAAMLAADLEDQVTFDRVVHRIEPSTMIREHRHLFSAPLPPAIAADGNDDEEDQRSRWHVHENGARLRPPHASLPDIARTGRGAFNHRGSRLYFSSSDGSSPRTNGRRYTFHLRKLRLIHPER